MFIHGHPVICMVHEVVYFLQRLFFEANHRKECVKQSKAYMRSYDRDLWTTWLLIEAQQKFQKRCDLAQKQQA